jgi:hypothetical protein
MTDELKPCPLPWCRSDDVFLNTLGNYEKQDYAVECRACGCSTDYKETAYGAIDLWNTRADNWQPIETAPTKRREPIWLWGPNYEKPGQAMSDTFWISGFSIENKPTHWMPRPTPEPPKEES